MEQKKWAGKTKPTEELTGNALLEAAKKILQAAPYESSHEARLEITEMRNADIASGRKL